MLKFAKTTILVLISFLLVACGGSGGGSSPAAPGLKDRGAVEMSIAWPEPSRYIPSYAKAIVFEGYLKSEPAIRFSHLAVRPAEGGTQRVRIGELLTPGIYVLAAAARANPDGSGSTVASALVEIEVKAKETARASMVLVSTIASLRAMRTSIPVGKAVDLVVTAVDPEGAIVFLPNNAISWRRVGGTAQATVTPQGTATASTSGTLIVEAAESEAGVKIEFEVSCKSSDGLDASPGATKGGPDRSRFVDLPAPAGVTQWAHPLTNTAISYPSVSSEGTVALVTNPLAQYFVELQLFDRNGTNVSWPLSTTFLVGEAELAWLSDDTILVFCSNSFYGRGSLMKVNVKTGEVIWTVDGLEESYSSHLYIVNAFSNIQVLDNGLVACGKVGIDLETGAIVWTISQTNGRLVSMAKLEDKIFFRCSASLDNLYVEAFSSDTGTKLWERAFSFQLGQDRFYGSISCKGDNIFLFGALAEGIGLKVLDASTGAVRKEEGFGSFSAVSVGKDSATFNGENRVFNLLNGTFGPRLEEAAGLTYLLWDQSPTLQFGNNEVLSEARREGSDESILVLYEPFSTSNTRKVVRWSLDLGGEGGMQMEAGPDGSVAVVTRNKVSLIR